MGIRRSKVMALEYPNLTQETRNLMVSEIDRDIADTTFGQELKRLTLQGEKLWPTLLKEAATNYEDGWLERTLNERGLLEAFETRHYASGKVGQVKVPYTAAQTLSEGEFNRYYMRALCLQAIAGQKNLRVRRAKPVANPRPESEAKIGWSPDPTALLNDLRANIAFDTNLGLPAGPNSGLSVELL